MAKDDQTTPGAEGADEEAKVEQEAAESKAADAGAAGSGQGAEGGDAATEEPTADAPDTDADDAKAEDAESEAEAEAAEADGEPEPEDEQARPAGRRRRGGAAAAGRSSERRPRRNATPDVTVRAKAKYVRCAPRKARLVVDHIRGKDIDQARAILLHTPRAAARDVLKLLESAVANAENNHELVADELRIGKAYVDEGPTLKRYRPRALGRATRIRKRTSHLTIELVAKG